MTFRSDFNDTLDPAIRDVLGEPAVWTPDGGSATPIVGIFEAEYFELSGDVAGVDSSAPAFIALGADVPLVAIGDALVFNTVSYIIVSVQPDGTGHTAMRLEEQ